jgi:hypothetical protein
MKLSRDVMAGHVADVNVLRPAVRRGMVDVIRRQAGAGVDVILIPGVVSHASNVVEHPELVADRILLYAGLVGCENDIAGTDCGMGIGEQGTLAVTGFSVAGRQRGATIPIHHSGLRATAMS